MVGHARQHDSWLGILKQKTDMTLHLLREVNTWKIGHTETRVIVRHEMRVYPKRDRLEVPPPLI